MLRTELDTELKEDSALKSEPQKSMSKIYDLTAAISEKTVVFPGDPEYKTQKVCSLEEGHTFNLCHMHFGNHTGTHVDFPAHVLKDAKTSSDYSIDHLIGSGLIIKVPDTEKSVTKQFVSEQPILKSDIVFFKTANSKLSKQDKFTEKYVYIEPDVAEELLKKGVKIVGIDYISVDRYDAEDLPVHKSLLSKEVLIVEGLELNNAPIGRCEIYIMPLNIPKMDGLPARVVAKL
ncbi:MAG: cyclase family protein [Gammaproteobacteria bacterium]